MTIPETFFSVRRELFLFFLSCAAGAVIGTLYDIIRVFRLTVKHGKIAVFAEDLLFLTGYAVFLPAFADALAWGELRFYFALGNFLGLVLYHFTVGAVVMNVIRTVLKLLRKIVDAVFLPPLRVCVLLCKKAGIKFVGCYKNMGNHLKKVKIHLQKRLYLLYNSNVSNRAENTDQGSTAAQRKVNHFAKGNKEKKENGQKVRKAKKGKKSQKI